MNAAQIHLALNHAPLFFSIIGGGILLLGMLKKNDSFKQLSYYFFVIAALIAIPVFLTGEGTEELVENLPGVTENAIEEHEEMAKISLLIISIAGAVSLIGLFLKRNTQLAKIVFFVVFILSLASFGTMAQTAHLGGLIRHSEIQSGSTINSGDKTGKSNTEPENKKEKDDDDD